MGESLTGCVLMLQHEPELVSNHCPIATYHLHVYHTGCGICNENKGWQCQRCTKWLVSVQFGKCMYSRRFSNKATACGID